MLYPLWASASDWTEADANRQRLVLGTLYVDYKQTKDIKNHKGMYETNPLLGRHPSDVRIRNYFLLAGVGHTALVYNMRPDMRRKVQYATIALQLAVILHNKQIGLNYEF